MGTAGYNLDLYTKRLAGVMAKLEADEYSFDYTGHTAWVEYRMEHSVSSALANGNPIRDGMEALCQIVLALEDVGQSPDRGVDDIQSWVKGLRDLFWSAPLPDCFQRLGFTNLPQSGAEVEQAVQKCPVGGSSE